MQHRIEILIYSHDGLSVVRSQIPLPSITASEFSPSEHMKTLFYYPDNNSDAQIRIWTVALPESKEEEFELIQMGKWGTLTRESQL